MGDNKNWKYGYWCKDCGELKKGPTRWTGTCNKCKRKNKKRGMEKKRINLILKKEIKEFEEKQKHKGLNTEEVL